jgi:hypothetical protein
MFHIQCLLSFFTLHFHNAGLEVEGKKKKLQRGVLLDNSPHLKSLILLPLQFCLKTSIILRNQDIINDILSFISLQNITFIKQIFFLNKIIVKMT